MALSLSVWLTFLFFVVSFGASASIAFADGQQATTRKSGTTQLLPTPDLTPRAVAKIVVEALGKNDGKDNGIRTTWKFTSPQNQAVTGPIEKFIPMVKNAAYQPLLNHHSAEVKELSVEGDTAAELAVITDSNGDKAYYIFQMRKQGDGDLKDCWLTDGVMRVEPGQGGAAKPVRPSPDGQFPA